MASQDTNDSSSDWNDDEPFTFIDFIEAVTSLPDLIERWNKDLIDKAAQRLIKRRRSRDKVSRYDDNGDLSQTSYTSSATPAKSTAIITHDLQIHSVKNKVAAVPRRVNEATNRELAKFRTKIDKHTQILLMKWREETTIRARDKFSFCVGVANLFFSALLVGIKPEWIPTWYTLQATYFLPLRVYLYKKKAFHYFIFDLCYFVNALLLIWLWILPNSSLVFTAVWCLSYGPLAFAVLTWKNSLVFHSLDKVTSLFIHIDPPFVLHAVRHLIKNDKKYPAISHLDKLEFTSSLVIASLVYCIWQLLYYVFIFKARAEKIKSGQRVTSFTWLVSKQTGLVGSILAKFPKSYQVGAFMALQYIYAILTMIPTILFWYTSTIASSFFLAFMLAISVWNGAGWYIDVWGRRFEKELLALKREIEQENNNNNNNSHGVSTAIQSSSTLSDHPNGSMTSID